MSEDDLDALALLHDPVRRSLYEAVAGRGGGVGRAEAAEAAGVSRTLAGHHLDRLVEAGLLESGFRAPERKGPGSGRPAKVYRRAPGERSVSLPAREYAALGAVLAEVVEALGAEEQAEAAARRAGERLGRRAALSATPASPAAQPAQPAEPAEPAQSAAQPAPAVPASSASAGGGLVDAVLRERGYEPYSEDGTVRMRNCPFHALALEQPLLVCTMNLALCQGLLEGLGDDPGRARLDPRPDECCVTLSKTNED